MHINYMLQYNRRICWNMKISDPSTGQKMIIQFVQEDCQFLNYHRSRLPTQILRDECCLNFQDMLEREWTVQQQEGVVFSRRQQATSKFLNQKNNHTSIETQVDKSEDYQKNAKIKKLASIQTIFNNPKPIQDLDLFLESESFKNCIRFFVLLNLIGLILTDYSFRLQGHRQKYGRISIYNKISLNLQLLANCAFSLEIILKMFCRRKFFGDPWRVINLIGSIACWITIFMDFQYYDSDPIFQVLICLKILLGIRVIQLFDFIRIPFQDFITTIPDLGKIFFPLFIFIAFYSILGLILFTGANQYRCRQTPEPQNNVWPQVSPGLCGSQHFECQIGYCGNPYDYGLPQNLTQIKQYGNQFGLVTFNNIGSSILTTYHYVFLSNWTSIKYKFSRFITPYITSIYFLSLAIFLFFIMANLNMITICKAYIQKQKNRQKMADNRNQQEDVQDRKKQQARKLYKVPEQRIKAYRISQYVQIFLILISSIIILIDYEGIEANLLSTLNYIDFVLTLIAILLAILKIIIMKKYIMLSKFNVLDWIVLSFNLIAIIYAAINEGNPINSTNQAVIILKTIKFVRIIRIIYFSEQWFAYEKTILKMFGETLKTMRSLFLLLCCLVLVTAFIGQNLFAFKVRFLPLTKQLNIQNGVPYVSNYESIYKALVSVVLMLQNQRWTETMYNYYRAVGWQAVLYFAIIMFVIHLMLMRLFIAIFLCYFRRNLQKNSSNAYQNLSNSGQSSLITTMNNLKDNYVVEYLQQKKIKGKFQQEQENERKKRQTNITLFWVFNRNGCFFQMLRAFYHSQFLKNVIFLLIGIHSLTIIIRSNQDTDYKTQILDSIQKAPLVGYCIEIIIGILGYGFIFGPQTYLRVSKMNIINFLVVIIIILSQVSFLGELEVKIIRRFSIIKIFTLLARTNKETSIILKSISNISQNFVRVFLIYVFLLIIPCLIPLKLQNDELYDCKNFHLFDVSKPTTYQECMLAGGDWVKDPQSFTNIFSSLILMYQIVTSESWTYYIQRLNTSRPWDIYFVITFFICNTCLLNIFVGMTVQTYLALKDQAYKLNMLRPNQRMWILIKNSINQLVPVPAMKEPQTNSFIRKISYKVISQNIYQNFIDIIAYINTLVFALRYYRADPGYLQTLYNINIVFISIFCLDTIMKLQLGWDYFFLDGSKVELMGLIFYVFYGIIRLTVDLDHDSLRALEFFGAILLILRCKKLIFRFTWSKTLINSVLDVLPKCIRIGQILAIVLFFYMAIGMQLFKYIKPTDKIDGYTTGFSNAITSLMTLLKIVSNESWFQQVSAHVRGSTSADICFSINSVEQAKLYNHMGCGSYFAYFFFISFHVIMALLILNLLIATMTAAYDQNYEKQYKSVNIFQLQDCLKLWQKYDPKGTAVIPYKKFWRLSSEIAILFGISKKKLIKSKQKFLEELDIQIYQSTNPQYTSVLCYKFHDVIMKFSKIKLQVGKNQENSESSQLADFQIHPMVQAEIKDYITETPQLYDNYRPFKNFKSGEMKYFFGLLRKLRAWKLVAKKKDSSVISKLSQIIKVALEKRQKQQQQMGHIRQHFYGPC